MLMKLTVLVFIAIVSRPAYADSFRCGGRIIELRDTEEYVREYCGAPTSQVRQQVRQRLKGRWWVTTRDIWTYDLGATEFVRILTFDADTARLIEIRLGDYGGAEGPRLRSRSRRPRFDYTLYRWDRRQRVEPLQTLRGNVLLEMRARRGVDLR